MKNTKRKSFQKTTKNKMHIKEYKNTTLVLFLKVLHQQFVKSFKQWVIFGLLILFCIFSILVYNYIYGFRQVFIERLRGVYPVTYIQSKGKVVPSFDPSFSHHQEYFYLSQSFEFQFKKNAEPLTILDVAMRATSIDRLPSIIEQPPDDNIYKLWVNQTMWNRISSSDDFDGKGLYLYAKYKAPIYVHLKKFDLLGNKPWIVFPKKLFVEYGKNLNITTIYPKNRISEKQIHRQYASKGLCVISWYERLPFFHKVFYQLTQRLYFTLIACFVTLLVILIFGVLKDTFDEFKKLITISSRYGVYEWFVQSFFICFISIYIVAILSISCFCVYQLDAYISKAVPVLKNIPVYGLSLQHYCIIIPVFSIISYFLVHRRIRKQIVAAEV